MYPKPRNQNLAVIGTFGISIVISILHVARKTCNQFEITLGCTRCLVSMKINTLKENKNFELQKKARSNLSSEASQLRRRTSVRFFIQSCIQDWICVMDVLNNMASHLYCSSDRLCISLALISFGVLVYGAGR